MTKFSKEVVEALEEYFKMRKTLNKEMYQFIKDRCYLIYK